MIPSEEQQTIIDHLQTGVNVVCSAIAGAGKSSTVLFLADQIPDKKMLQITYNSQLRLEVKERVKEAGLKNLTVHTFHSLAVRTYNPLAHTDTELRKIIATNQAPRDDPRQIDILILDEMQDSTKLYYQLIQKYLVDMVAANPDTKIQILVLGDVLQGLYEFKGSDTRFLTLAKELWEKCPYLASTEFVPCTLKMSYRITRQMASFVNNVLLGMPNHLLACKDGSPVTYIRENRYTSHRKIVNSVLQLMNSGAKPDDFFILGASMKNSIRMLENELVENGVPCHVPMFEKEKMDDRVIKGKVVFSTFHSVKGRQRKHVYVMGFDQSYFEYYAKELDRSLCPNTLYVACTRATDCLTVVEKNEDATNRPLPFLKKTHLELRQTPYVNFIGSAQVVISDLARPKVVDENFHFICPTELIKFISNDVLDLVTPLVDAMFTRVSRPEDETEIDLVTVIETKLGLCEDVSDLNGIAIPCIYTDRVLHKEGDHILYELTAELIKTFNKNQYTYLRRMCESAPRNPGSIRDILYLANLYSAVQSKLYFKIKQIGRDEYTWLSESMIEKCIGRLQRVVASEKQRRCAVEQCIINPEMTEENKMINACLSPFFGTEQFRFTAIVDMVCDSVVWELKCTSSTTLEHFLQVIVYAWLWRVLEYPQKEFRIFNIKTGEIFLLMEVEIDKLTEVVVALLKAKFLRAGKKTDEAFLLDAAGA